MNQVTRLSAMSAGLLSVLLLTACGTPTTARQSPPVPEAAEPPARLSAHQANDVTIYALGLVGTPYRYGGNTPEGGFDCSGLIGHVYQSRAGVAAPRTVSRLQFWGSVISDQQVRSGDLVLFAQRDGATHAGIYVGAGRFVHAPSAGGTVRLDNVNSAYWSKQRPTFRRP
jgi:cell wall-associated NlpC family hydrolase